MPYLLDADIVIQALAGKAGAPDILEQLAPEGIAINWITIGEVYEGAYRSANPGIHLATFRQFLRPFRTLDLNDDTMERFAQIHSALRQQGQMIPDFDILLGATALHYDLTVLTFNFRHLKRIPELKLYQPG
jgi:tRNA(fMet)-specific endonuclease VapC